jgi:serine/threonine protein kinase
VEGLLAQRYQLEKIVGSGAMGTVWRAHDMLLDRQVAIKEVRYSAQLTDQERQEQTARAVAEARHAARLEHPCIVPIYDVLIHDGRPWIVMRFIPGRSLQEQVAVEGRLTPDGVQRIGRGLLQALAAAHRGGVLHRDVKPSNVLIAEDGEAMLTDFSIARTVGQGTVTNTGLIVGSPGYIAPERVINGTAGPEADLFGLGATLFFAAEGVPPFVHDDAMAGAFATAVHPHPRPQHAGPALTPLLDGLLEKDPRQRLSIPAAAQLLGMPAPSHTPAPSPTPPRPAPISAPPPPVKPDTTTPPLQPDTLEQPQGPAAQPGVFAAGRAKIAVPEPTPEQEATQPAGPNRWAGGRLALIAALVVVLAGAAAALTQIFDLSSKDSAQPPSSPSPQPDSLTPIPTETARWPLGEPAGSTTATDSTGGGHAAAVSLTAPATLGGPGRIVNGATALSLDGAAANTVATTGPVVDTGRNFTVAAWVRLADGNGNRGVVGQDGAHTSGFKLQYSNTCACWQFSMPATDAVNPASAFAQAPGPARLNVWTHLVGVYDRGTGTAKLYVNGMLAATASGPAAPWNATGPLRIGRSKWNDKPVDFFTGRIADVRVWDRTLSDSEIAAVVDPTGANNIATDVVGQWFVEPASCFGNPRMVCQDSSGHAHRVNLSGGVTTTTGGHTGSGLQYNGTNGVAQTTDPNTGGLGPVLHTDASFTVSAWMKLDSMPNGNRTAMGQSGTKMSPFYFGTRNFNSGTTPYWVFAMVDADTDSTLSRTARSAAAITTADIGQWFHLVGVYDAYAGTISLYINGTLAGSATRTATPWDAAGPLTIGAVLWTPVGSTPRLVDSWNGTIDTVTVYAGAVPAASIRRIP